MADDIKEQPAAKRKDITHNKGFRVPDRGKPKDRIAIEKDHRGDDVEVTYRTWYEQLPDGKVREFEVRIIKGGHSHQ